MRNSLVTDAAWSDGKGLHSRETEALRGALRELIEALELKASGRANPETYFSPRMRRAVDEAKALLDSK